MDHWAFERIGLWELTSFNEFDFAQFCVGSLSVKKPNISFENWLLVVQSVHDQSMAKPSGDLTGNK